MHIREVTCPQCDSGLVVDGSLFEIGTVRLRCSNCARYFLPTDSPHLKTIEEATNASVNITIWEPGEAE